MCESALLQEPSHDDSDDFEDCHEHFKSEQLFVQAALACQLAVSIEDDHYTIEDARGLGITTFSKDPVNWAQVLLESCPEIGAKHAELAAEAAVNKIMSQLQAEENIQPCITAKNAKNSSKKPQRKKSAEK